MLYACYADDDWLISHSVVTGLLQEPLIIIYNFSLIFTLLCDLIS